MNKTQQRQEAMQVTRGQMRFHGFTPEKQTSEQALAVLDDLTRQYPTSAAGKWYAKATENQIKLFIREWRRWRAKRLGGA